MHYVLKMESLLSRNSTKLLFINKTKIDFVLPWPLKRVWEETGSACSHG